MASNTAGTEIFVPYATPGEIIAAGVVLPVLGIFAVLLRFYVRGSRGNKIGLDDWFIVPALFMIIGIGAALIAGVKKKALGFPTPPSTATTTAEVLTEINPLTSIAEQIEWAVTLLLILAYGFIKISIVLFYRRIFVVAKSGIFNFLTWVLFGIIIVWTIAFFFTFLFLCGTHVDAHWGSREDLLNYCHNSLQKEQSLYISEFITNILLLVLPIPMIWRLHMPTGRKLAVTGILMLAFMALVASIIRLGIIIKLTTGSIATLHFDEDLTISTIYYWGMIEAGLALIAACLPTLKALVSTQGIQSAVASVRSAISLQSMQARGTNGSNGSKGSKGSKNSRTTRGVTNPYNKIDAAGSTDATPLRGDAIAEMNSTVSHIDEPKAAAWEPGKIRVKREVDMSNDYA